MDQLKATHIQREMGSPIRSGLSWHETWQGPDHGLIRCWEIGRQRAEANPDLAQRCREGQLPVLGWKGGHERALRKTLKFGSFKYLAQWQGLRGDNLEIDPGTEITLNCSQTGMLTTFTPDREKYANATNQAE
ncbi:hypothetical protein P0Y43_18520 [Pseudomonas entomophila]|uniref:hypothetical protein n=1 Tax=Pseudomonas entomophila TaxID=312306 RepID=UPI0023D87522|nr:hypothetical protein [Pseudomonas entomophila]MDF0732685.1 hypothetical protein [Pseudomonas entomophila]